MKILARRGFIILIIALCFSPFSLLAQKNVPVNQKPNVPKPGETRASTAMEIAVLEEINLARSDPQKYVVFLEEYKKLFKGNVVYLPGFLRVQTNEGKTPVEEAIEYLKTLPKLKPFTFSNSLNKAANLQLADLIADSTIGHTGRDGSDLKTRLKRFGMVGELYAENIAYYADTAREIVLTMIVDDGVKSRNHRKNVFSQNLRLIGIAFGKGKTGEGLCVADFTDYFIEAPQKSGGARLIQ